MFWTNFVSIFLDSTVLRLSRFHFFLAFLAIMMLRVAVGYHFFKEGASKIQSGNFTAEYFLKSAKGPLAPYFRQLLDDPNAQQKLCIKSEPVDDSDPAQPTSYRVDPELTFAIWLDYVDQAKQFYDFDEANTLAAEEIRESHEEELSYWLSNNETELIQHYSTAKRLNGFDRDGDQREKIAVQVASLREQVDKIRGDRNKKVGQWTGEVTAIWDSLENQINAIADVGPTKKMFPVHRPFKQKLSKLQVINRFIPWFDLIVGALLILGLFSRLASLAGAGFLASVIATQPPWIPGTTPTYYQAIELFALIVIFATCAGRIGGLDFFLHGRTSRKTSSTTDQND